MNIDSEYKLLFEMAEEGMLLAGGDGRISDANPAACRLLGRPREGLVGSGYWDAFGPSVGQFKIQLEMARERVRQTGNFAGGLGLPREDGSALPVEARISSNGDGTSIVFRRSIAGGEEEAKALRESAAQYRALVENSPDFVMVFNFDNTFRYLNPAVKQVLGYEPEELIGTFLPEITHPDYLEAGAKFYLESVNTPGPAGPYTAPYRHKDGSYRYLEGVVNNLMDDPDVRGTVATTRDVTERIEAEEALRESEERLARLNRDLARSNAELEQFAYVVSHGLRSPLRGMVGYGRMLLEDHAESLDEEGRDHLRRLESSGRHAQRLVEDILDLSRATYRPLRKETVDLSALARSVAAQLREAEPGREAEFEIEDGLLAEGDPSLLRLLLENLLSNAWKYTGKKELAKIGFGATEVEGTKAYFVRDDGAGFDPEGADQLFEPFRRLHGADQFEGTGIGLATVERVVERHGGRVWAEGEEGRGAAFYFTLEPDGASARGRAG